MKVVKFIDSALEDLRAFPRGARRDAGFELNSVQNDLAPKNWKPMSTVGPNVKEIRIVDQKGIYRVVYVAKFREAL